MRKARLVVTCAHDAPYEVRLGVGVLSDLGHELARALAGAGGVAGGPGAGGAARAVPLGSGANTDAELVREAVLLYDATAGEGIVRTAKQALAQAGFKTRAINVFPDNALEAAGELWRALAQLNLSAQAVVVALGDTPLLNLAGFAATAFGEGLACAFAPTTLEAAACQAVANQAVLDVPGARGQVRAAMHPLFSCVDLDAFQENAPERWMAGFARVVQAAVMDSDDFFFWLSDSAAALRNRDAETLCAALVRTLGFHSRVLALDEQGDACAKTCLSYGEELSAGESVPLACGMRFSALLSQFKGLISEDIVQAQDTLLTQVGCLPPRGLDAARLTDMLLQHAGANAAGRAVVLVLPTNIGSWQEVLVPAEELRSCLEVL